MQAKSNLRGVGQRPAGRRRHGDLLFRPGLVHHRAFRASFICAPGIWRRQALLPRIKGATATHMASGRGLPILGDIAATGTAIMGVSALEDLAQLKAAANGRVSLLGNLNGIEMRRWSPAQAEAEVRRHCRSRAGGGFLLSDNHGEIPLLVPDEVLLAIGDAVDRWGRYPLDWIADWQDEPRLRAGAP
jgi:hypothetical protein